MLAFETNISSLGYDQAHSSTLAMAFRKNLFNSRDNVYVIPLLQRGVVSSVGRNYLH
jgi:hypothetical protein